jgi:deazaflavin-dependent oxidoreductase (nitroreductase family)
MTGRILRWLLKLPVVLYRMRLGGLLGRRFLLLTHIGRKSGLLRRTVLEVLSYDCERREAVVMAGFGRGSQWVQNLEAGCPAAITIGREHFPSVAVRWLAVEEAVLVFGSYEARNRLFAPFLRVVLSSILGWAYHGTPQDRRRAVAQLPLLALRRTTTADRV